MRDASRLIQNVDLTAEDVLGLLVCVLRNVARWACLDLVEPRGQVGG
jgi:hypothetical protein